ncbi:MAG: flavin monoamine oxidase family protein [Arachnia sp.]
MFDCAIIGAGLAGLTAALDLRARGLSLVVLEARARVGGRVDNGYLDDGQYVELGGQWIGAGHDSLLDLADRYGIGTVGVPAPGAMRVRHHGQAHSLESGAPGQVLTPFEVSDLAQGILRLRRLGQRRRDDAVWAQANQAWLGQDLQRWITSNLRTGGARDRLLDAFDGALGGVGPGVSLAQGIDQVQAGTELDAMLVANGGLNQLRIAGGVYELCQAIAADLGDLVRLSSPVTHVTHTDASACLRIADGSQFTAKRIISTMPPRLAVALDYEPALALWRAELADKVPAGNVIKAFLVYEKPFWRDEGLSGQSSADDGAVRVTLDTTTDPDGHGVLMGFFEGAEAESLAARSAQLRERAFTEAAVRMFGEQAARPLSYLERDWSAEEFTRGCHGAHFAPGVWGGNGPALAEPDGVVHWAGSEYAAKFNGYLEGAVRSARAVAGDVARALA